jgi:hypothetical protein
LAAEYGDNGSVPALRICGREIFDRQTPAFGIAILRTNAGLPRHRQDQYSLKSHAIDQTAHTHDVHERHFRPPGGDSSQTP